MQRTIIMMELKQMAESIAMIKYKKKVKKPNAVKFRNRPLVWAERIENTARKAIKSNAEKRKENLALLHA